MGDKCYEVWSNKWKAINTVGDCSLAYLFFVKIILCEIWKEKIPDLSIQSFFRGTTATRFNRLTRKISYVDPTWKLLFLKLRRILQKRTHLVDINKWTRNSDLSFPSTPHIIQANLEVKYKYALALIIHNVPCKICLVFVSVANNPQLVAYKTD